MGAMTEPASEWVQPSWSNSYRSVQNLLSKFIYSDSLKNRSTALTSNDADVDGADAQLAEGQPWDRQALLQRLRTFRPGTWFGKPARISAAVCASHGWTNSGMDALKCAACNAVLSFTSSDTLHGHDADALVDTFLSDLSQKHEAYCLWHSHEPTRHDLIAFPAAQPAAVCEAFVGRIAELGQLDSLPHLGGAGMALLTDRCLNQLIALLEATAVPIARHPSSAGDATGATGRNELLAEGDSERFELSMLARRPVAFSLAAKVIAALGWRVKPLSGRTLNAAGRYAMADCMLTCPTCTAATGLWSQVAAAETEGTLGCSGLLGKWGAGAQAGQGAGSSLQSMSIAGGVAEGTPGASANPWLPASTVVFAQGGFGAAATVPTGGGAPARAQTPPRLARRSSPDAAPAGPSSGSGAATEGAAFGGASGPFGASSTDAPFGASVSLVANAFSSAKPAGVASGGAGASSRKRKRARESDGAAGGTAAGAEETRAKVARIMQEMFDESLKEEVAARLRAAGLPLGKSEDAFDPVMSHRAWCPWVYSDTSAGWRQLLNAVAPAEHLPAALAETLPAASSEPATVRARSNYDSGPRHIFKRKGKRSSLVSTAHDLLGRLSRRHIVAPVPPEAQDATE